YTAPRIVPRDEDLKRAAEVLNAGQKVAMLVGAGCMRSAAEVVQVADVLGAGIAKALWGKAVLPDATPGCTGSIGLLGTKASWKMMSECDTLLMVGSSFPYSEFLPKEGQARGVQIDLKGRMLGIRYPMEVNLHGDAAETLRALLPYLKRKVNRGWRQQIEGSMREWRQILEAHAAVEAKPINAAFVSRDVNPRFVVLVLNNRDLNMVTWELRAQAGEPKFEGSQEIPDFPYAGYAESLGLLGLRVDRPEDVGRTWDAALAADRPVLVEALVDPE